MLPARAMDTIEAAQRRPRRSQPTARNRSVITSKDEDMGKGPTGETTGGKRTVPRVRFNRCPVGRQILGAELGHKLANRFPVDLVTG
jgi:hypothetical protein